MIAGMASIRKLAPELVNQIAAGEVIERPASVVKELVENAIDAGARRVEVALEDGGKRLVRVADDGCGIAAEELLLAVESHATSKLAAAEDLFCVRTLGFRGEALASMGSVADLRIASRLRAEGAEGAEIRVRGGAAEAVRPAGVAPGTTVEVRDLFFNTPARRKFLREGAGELRPAIEALQRLALGAPGVGFRLVHRGPGEAGESGWRLIFDARPTADPLERIADLFGRDLAADLVPVDGARGSARIAGFAALPRRTRGDAREQHVTMNGRPVRDRLIGAAVREAYQGFLMTRRFPIVFLALELAPEMVDVNVHPAKLEVRFREPREIFSLVRGAIAATLEDRKAVPALEPRGGAKYEPQRTRRPRSFRTDASAYSIPESSSGSSVISVAEERPVWGAPAADPTPPFLQLASGYLVVAAARGFEVIDPHALHERILYEEWKARLATGAVEVQQLLLPILVDLAPLDEARLADLRAPLAALGLVVEPFGPGTAAIQAVPALADRRAGRDWGGALRGLLAVEEDGGGPARATLLESLTATIACKAAVKLGERLRPEEVAALLARRAAADRSHLCPHGRPTALAFEERDLERQFKR